MITIQNICRLFRTTGATLACVASLVTLPGCILNLPSGLFGNQRGPISEQEIIPAEGSFVSDKIAVIDITGVITDNTADERFATNAGTLVEIKDRLKFLEDDNNVRAVILRIDSPGGEVTASDLIHNEILTFKKKIAEKQRRKVPVIAMLGGIAASGGLYVAMAADEIYASPTTITGSIGVIVQLPEFAGIAEKVGFKMRVIKSGQIKDIGSPWRGMTDQEREILQSLINASFDRFKNTILTARKEKGLTPTVLNTIADGRVFDSARAVQVHLIDGIAYPDQVIVRAKKVGGVEDAAVVTLEYPAVYRGNIYARGQISSPTMSGPAGDINLIKFDGDGSLRAAAAAGRFHYLWVP